MRLLRRILSTLKAALAGWWNDNVPRLGASLAYYTLFAIAPVLLVAIAVAGLVFGEDAVRGQVVSQLQDLLGRQSAQTIQSMLQSVANRTGGIVTTIIGVVTFVFAATGAFLELQAALNAIWRVQPTAGTSVLAFLKQRLISFGLVVGVGFLLVVSLAVSAALAALGKYVGGIFPGWVITLQVLNVCVSLGVVTLLFAMVYKVLPDVRLRWRDVWTGAFVTAVLFTIGKTVIGLYLGQSSTASAYGAAGSVIVVLLWVYYASQIVLLGAEFTRAWTERSRGGAAPEHYATHDPAAAKDASKTDTMAS